MSAKQPSTTKSGPSRFHKSGHQKATPIKSHGATAWFVIHAASPAKRERRALVKVHGRRQALRQIKHDRAEMKLERAIEEGEARGYVAPDA